jgi:phospho-N-acetylmuramoyl-pentapeptide-transferase
MHITNAIKILGPTAFSFFIGILITPILTHYLYKHKAWKKRAGNTKGIGDNNGTPIFNELHREREIKTPRMGGLVVVSSVSITVAVFWLLSYLSTGGPSGKIDFLSRSQTWLPLAGFLIGALVGFIEDMVVISKSHRFPDGIPFQLRSLPLLLFGLFSAWWFYEKLGISSVFVPFLGHIDIGIWFIPFFLVVLLSTLASGVIDGLDGLSGGVLAIVFSALGIIAAFNEQINLSAFTFVIVGGLLAFLWFNIPPARFYLTEVGFIPLAITMTLLAFLTDTVLLLPLIAFVQFATVATNILQVASKKFRKKKIFLVAPIHHHFEAIGWPAYKVVMRYWVLSIICAVLGVLLALLG